MKVMPHWYIVIYDRYKQVYDLLVDGHFYDEAREFGNTFCWECANLADVKAFFKRKDLHPSAKQGIFMILNNKACYFHIANHMFNFSSGKSETYIGFNLIEGEI